MSGVRENLSYEQFGVAWVRSAVVHGKTRSLVTCGYVWKRTDEWIDFPSSVQPPVVRRDEWVLDA